MKIFTSDGSIKFLHNIAKLNTETDFNPPFLNAEEGESDRAEALLH
jgi:hypothetical protein